MYYAYILKSELLKAKHYVGYTADLKTRLYRHNSGAEQATKYGKPWVLLWYGTFQSKPKALAFEKYLKSGSGHSFRKRHLLA